MEKEATTQVPAPTTYIQAEVAAFKDLVQKLTGGSPHKLRPKNAVGRRSPFKLQERRKHSVRNLEIIKFGVELSAGKCSPAAARRNALPSPAEGPGTPLGCDRVAVETESPASEEERAIAKKGFYLHASPAAKAVPPVLLTLFPLTSKD